MFRNLFRILFRPQVTLDELLEEQRNVRSWSATMWLVFTNVAVIVLLSVFAMHKLTDLLRAMGEMPQDRGTLLAMSSSFALSMVQVVVTTLVRFVGGRYAFGWIVQLGLRMVASREYPQDPDERWDRAFLVRLVHPYTNWLTVLPYLLSIVVLTLMVAFTPVPDLNQISQDAAGDFAAMVAVALLIWLVLTGVVSFCMWIYMIIVRTSAIQKIYRVSVAQAFWGPFLVYAMLYFVVFIVGAIWFVIALLHGDAPQNNLNFM